MGKGYTVAITCIGSGISQSVINALRRSSFQVRTVGFGNQPYDYGALDCDVHEIVPSVHAPQYVDELIKKCLQHDVDILIPGLDDELLILAENRHKINQTGLEILIADRDVIALCRDKERLGFELNQRTDSFVPSFTAHNIMDAIRSGEISFPCVAKPRKGSGSVGIELIRDPQDIQKVSGEYIFQELLLPAENDPYYGEFQKALQAGRVPQLSELSVQYVTGRDGEYLGRLATINKLKYGVPVEIFPVEEQQVWDELEAVIPYLSRLGLRGPVNLQGRITDQGVRFFEINPRFTGLTGMRALYGFNEVEACLKSWLGISSSAEPYEKLPEKFGLRQVADRAVPLDGEHKNPMYRTQRSAARSEKVKTLLVTGSSGYLGRNLIPSLDPDRYKVWVLSTNPDRARALLGDVVDHYYGEDVFRRGELPWGGVDILLHAGFARPYRAAAEIAHSLDFTASLFRYASMNHVPSVVNISSQSVYGQGSPLPWQEDSPLSPDSSYAAAKYAAELMLNNLKQTNYHLAATSLRLAGVTGGQKGLVPVDLVSRFVQQALRGEPLELYGRHRFERMDIRDAVEGLRRFLAVPSAAWDPVYNFGRGKSFSIKELAQEIVHQVRDRTGRPVPDIIENYHEDPLRFGMDSTAFYDLTGWKPAYSLADMVRSLVNYYSPGDFS